MAGEDVVIVLVGVLVGSILTYLINYFLQKQTFEHDLKKQERQFINDEKIRMREKKEDCIRDLFFLYLCFHGFLVESPGVEWICQLDECSSAGRT